MISLLNLHLRPFARRTVLNCEPRAEGEMSLPDSRAAGNVNRGDSVCFYTFESLPL